MKKLKKKVSTTTLIASGACDCVCWPSEDYWFDQDGDRHGLVDPLE